MCASNLARFFASMRANVQKFPLLLKQGFVNPLRRRSLRVRAVSAPDKDSKVGYGDVDKDIVEQKAALRQKMRELRYMLPLGEYHRMSEAIESNLLATPEFRTAKHVCCYVHKESTREPETITILHAVLADTKKVLVVPITRVKDDRLDLSVVQDLGDLVPSTFGVAEPVHEKLVKSDYVDFIIVPCLAADLHGIRLGYGKAYYDKLLSVIPKRVAAFALAFDFQVLPNIPSAAHDKHITAIVTEKRIIRCSP